MKNKTLKTLFNVLKEIFSIIYIIILIVFIFATFGLGFLFIDSINKKENKYDDWTLMEEWERKETKKAIKKLKERKVG